MYNQEEAKTKWCPMVRYEGDEHGSWNAGQENVNRQNINAGITRYQAVCIASDCMMWRWDISAPNMGGYCGIGGKP